MKTRHLTSGLIALALILGGGAFANEIYKYTDAEGNVHYTDRPSGESNEERLQVSYNRTNNSAVQERVKTRLDAASKREEARSEAQQAQQAAEDERVAAEQKAAKCADYRQKMKSMLEARRVYREDENGERVYLDDVARAEARTKAEELIKEHCGN
jgi:membrane protein involved in colicin uptake